MMMTTRPQMSPFAVALPSGTSGTTVVTHGCSSRQHRHPGCCHAQAFMLCALPSLWCHSLPLTALSRRAGVAVFPCVASRVRAVAFLVAILVVAPVPERTPPVKDAALCASSGKGEQEDNLLISCLRRMAEGGKASPKEGEDAGCLLFELFLPRPSLSTVSSVHCTPCEFIAIDQTSVKQGGGGGCTCLLQP